MNAQVRGVFYRVFCMPRPRPVGIGSDDPNANQSVNLISEMKFVTLAQNQR